MFRFKSKSGNPDNDPIDGPEFESIKRPRLDDGTSKEEALAAVKGAKTPQERKAIIKRIVTGNLRLRLIGASRGYPTIDAFVDSLDDCGCLDRVMEDM